ncbi:MAG TPA: cupin domain-containing protein [Rubrobacter sp.]|nr:cupin domain-containing protein [Rubrobacter sp.]
MARAGQEIYNPVQNDWIVFRQTAQDTGGELMRGELIVSPGGGNPLHVHPLQEEHFKALSGTLGVQMGEDHRSLEEGEEAVVPPGTPHRWWNAEDQAARVLVELRPALNTEIFFETLYGLARDGKTDENGVPNLLQQAVTLNGINKGEVYLARPPIPVQKASLAVLAPVGRMLGYKDHYPKYSGAETPSGEGAGPPSKGSVMARGVAMVASLLVAFLFLRGLMRRHVRAELRR